MLKVPDPPHTEEYSPCYSIEGIEYHLVVHWGGHPNLRKGAPLRVSGSGPTRDSARSNARAAWSRAYACLRTSPPVSA
jgi:hypothetical protein